MDNYELSAKVDSLIAENKRLRAALDAMTEPDNNVVMRFVKKGENVKGVEYEHEVVPIHEGLFVHAKVNEPTSPDEMQSIADLLTDQIHEIGPAGMEVAVVVSGIDMSIDAFLVKRRD